MGLKEKIRTSEEIIKPWINNTKGDYSYTFNERWVKFKDVLLAVKQLKKEEEHNDKIIFGDCNPEDDSDICLKCPFWRCEGCRLNRLLKIRKQKIDEVFGVEERGVKKWKTLILN